MYIVKDKDSFRKKIIDKFNIKIKNIKKSTNLEKGLFNNVLIICDEKNIVKKWENRYFCQIYIDKFKSIYQNLDNNYIQKLLQNEKYKVHKIAFMTHQEMMPEKWKLLIEEKKIRDENKYEPKLEASTDDFTCWKCKNKRCTYYQLQTRSADEPMTTYVTCLNCGQRWKC